MGMGAARTCLRYKSTATVGAAGSRTGPLREYQRRYAAGPGRVPSKSGCTQPAVLAHRAWQGKSKQGHEQASGADHLGDGHSAKPQTDLFPSCHRRRKTSDFEVRDCYLQAPWCCCFQMKHLPTHICRLSRNHLPVAGVSIMAVGAVPSFRKYCSVRYVSIDSTFCWPPAFQYPGSEVHSIEDNEALPDT